MKRKVLFLILGSLLALSLCACGSSGEDANGGKNDVDPEVMETLCSQVKEVLEDNFKDHYDISYDENMLIVKVWIDGMAAEALQMKENGGAENEGWVDLTASMKTFAELICQLIENSNGGRIHLNLSLMNDTNLENTLLTFLDTEVFDDALK